MPDISSITGAIGAVKAATEVAKVLRNLDSSIQSADLKFKIAELTEALGDAKLAISEVQETLIGKDKEIARLVQALKTKDEVIRHSDAYYLKGTDQQPSGDPFCSNCFEIDHVLVHINQNPQDRRQSICPNCKNVFNWQRRQDSHIGVATNAAQNIRPPLLVVAVPQR
jgi:hypothetical protein